MGQKPAKTEESSGKSLQEGFSASLSIETLDDVSRAAKMIYNSGCLGSFNNPEEVGAKIMTGLEIGLSPMTSVRNIYFFDGSTTLSGPILAALIREDHRYDYEILGSNEDGAKVRFYRKVAGEWETQNPDVSFTRAMAEKAGLMSKQNWQHYKEDMYVWRCIARGKRWHCPEIGNGTIYIRDEVEETSAGAPPSAQKQVRQNSRDQENPKGGPGGVEVKTQEAEAAVVSQNTVQDRDDEDKDDLDFQEKPETTETKPADPPGEENIDPSEQPEPEENGSENENVKNEPETQKKTANSGAEEEDEDSRTNGKAVAGGIEQKEDRKNILVPGFVSVNVGAITDDAAHEIQQIHGTLKTISPGNELLDQIKTLRDDVRDSYPSKDDVDRVALEEVLDHHRERIGSKSTVDGPGIGQTKDSVGDGGAPEKDDFENDWPQPYPELEWLYGHGSKFHEDMKGVIQSLNRAMEKLGITPLRSRLHEVKDAWEESSSSTPEMEMDFEKELKPYEAIIKMREALIGGHEAEIQVFNVVANEFLDEIENWYHRERRRRAEYLVLSEAERLSAEFEDLNLKISPPGKEESVIEANGPETARETPREGEGSGSTGGDEDQAQTKAPNVPNIPLPPGFPKEENLKDAGIDKTGGVARQISEGTVTDISGIGPKSADKIEEYLRQISELGEEEPLMS